MSIYGNAVGGNSLWNTVTLIDENGEELTGVVVDSKVELDATDNDVREGLVYASDGGVSTGTKVIPSYHTTEAVKYISAGSELSIQLSRLDLYDYTKLQIIICPYNNSLSNSVSAEKVVINNNVYNAGETTSISTVFKNDINKTIELGITNDGDTPLILRYFTYKEID